MNDHIRIELNFDGHFLDCDLQKAIAEVSCMVDCYKQIFLCINEQDYARALFHIENFRRSVAELKRLNDRKKIYEQVRDLLQEVLKGGVSNG